MYARVGAGPIREGHARENYEPHDQTENVRSQLKEEPGVELLVRERKRLNLSSAGRRLLGYADRLITLAEEARDAMHETAPRGPLRLGSMESTAAIRLPAPLNLFHQRYPEVTLGLRTGHTKELTPLVLSGELDAALVAEPVADTGLDKAIIYDEELAFMAPACHPLIRSPRDIVQQTILAFEAGCSYRLRVEQWFARSNGPPPRIVEMTSWHAILGCTVAGMGVSILPKMLLTTFPQRVFLSVHPLPPAFARAPTVLIWRKGTHAPTVTALLEVLTTHAAEEAKVRPRNGSNKRVGKPRRRQHSTESI